MPDLSKRPERYATVLVAALIAGSFAYSALGVRFGKDPRVALLQAENQQLQRKANSDSEAVAAAKATSGSDAVTTALSTMNCSAFGNQQAAQKYWLAHKAE